MRTFKYTPENSKELIHKKKFLKGKSATLFWVFLILVSAAIIYRVIYFYLNQKDFLTNEMHSNLGAIADLKVNQIEDWRNDRIIDGEIIASNKMLCDKIRAFHEDNSAELKDDILKWVKSLIRPYRYKAVHIVDEKGKSLLGIPYKIPKQDSFFMQNLQIASKTKRVLLSDFHFYEGLDSIHLDLIIPLTANKDNGVKEILFLEINPNDFLFPLIQNWPTASKTGESLLIEKDSNTVVYLNELRHQKNTALKLKISTNEENILAVKAIKGATGFVEGLDYRQKEVMGVIKTIAESKWVLIAKIDKEELYSPINQITFFTAVLLGLLLLIAISVILYYLKNQKTIYYRNLYESELTRKALSEHFEHIVKYANDIILLVNKNGDIVEANDRAVNTYGYSFEELLQLNIRDLRAPEVRKDLDSVLKEIHKSGSLIYETFHLTKAGISFPIEISSREITIEGYTFIQGIIRDITERKKAEEKIYSLNRIYAVLSQINEAIVWTNDRDKLFSKVCEIAIKYGKFKMAWIGLLDEKTHKVIPVAKNGISNGYLESINITDLEEPEGSGPTGRALRDGKFYICNDIKNSPDMKLWCEKAIKYGFLSSAAFPLKQEEKVIGTLNLYSEQLNFFKDDELSLLDEVALDISYALNTFEKDSQRQVAIEALSNSEKKFKTVFESANDAFLLIDGNMFIDFNKKAEELYGLTREKLLFKTPVDLSPEKQSDGISSAKKARDIIQQAQKGLPMQFEWTHKKPDGKLFDTEVSLTPILLGNKNLMLAVVRDITEKKMILESITNARDFYLTLFEEFPAMIWRSGVDSKTNYINKNWLNFTGKTFEQAIKDSWEVSVHPDERQNCSKVYLDSFKLRKSFVMEYRLKNKNGEYRWIEDIGRPYNDLDGTFAGYIGVCFDITEKKNAEEKMRIAKEKAEEMNRLKSNFLANMSHELRTPMTGILGFAEILHSEIPDPDYKEMAGLILKGGKRLTNTLNSILDLSRIEADKMDLKLEVINIAKIVKESVEFFEAATKEKNLDISYEVKGSIYANLDKRVLEQVLYNLIQNSVVYTEKGSIKIKVEKGTENNSGFVNIKIIDTGIGIPEKYISAIFEPFRQVSSGLGRKYEGTGLGLTLTKKFVELLGGQINVESKFGAGSTFTVKFQTIPEPFIIEEKPKETDYYFKPREKNGKKILLVEDDEDNVATIKVILKDICNIDTADTGKRAIEMVKENKYDVILMDIGLRGMSGLEAAQEIKKLPGYEKIPIVAVTAYAMVGDKEKFLAGGCSHYISKPFKINEFKELVTKLL